MKTIHEKTSRQPGTLPGMRQARRDSGKTMPELHAEIGFSITHLYAVEYCKVGASGVLASKIADALNVSTDYLFGRQVSEAVGQ